MTAGPGIAPRMWMTLHDRVAAARGRLVAAGLPGDSAAFDAEALARIALGWTRAEYLARRSDPPPPGFAAAYDRLVARRERREPVAQIAGVREFWTRDFEVSRDVLTPRPETELIVEEALANREAASPGPRRHGIGPDEETAARRLRVVDVGTGSGCLAVTLALEMPEADVLAVDISERALVVARRNADRLGAGDRVRFVRTSLLEGLAPGIDLIVSNPPYVPDGQRQALSSEVRDYEPREAVLGGPDGFDVIRHLLAQASERLAPGGRLLMEFGAGQDDGVRTLIAHTAGVMLHSIRQDLQGIPRMAVVGLAPDGGEYTGHRDAQSKT
jgi:release factor glutamine methyltransferase